jgi:ADP-ribose pyrophosphatase
MSPDNARTLWSGQFLSVKCRGTWEYVSRPKTNGVVAIVALTRRHELILTEQFRPPLNSAVIELPAGLVGDEPESQSELALAAAQRELLEETGYVATTWTHLMSAPSSAGLADEVIELYLAVDTDRRTAGGGVAQEDIRVHLVPIAEAEQWLERAVARGCMLDFKVMAGLYFARRYLGSH